LRPKFCTHFSSRPWVLNFPPISSSFILFILTIFWWKCTFISHHGADIAGCAMMGPLEASDQCYLIFCTWRKIKTYPVQFLTIHKITWLLGQLKEREWEWVSECVCKMIMYDVCVCMHFCACKCVKYVHILRTFYAFRLISRCLRPYMMLSNGEYFVNDCNSQKTVTYFLWSSFSRKIVHMCNDYKRRLSSCEHEKCVGDIILLAGRIYKTLFQVIVVPKVN
jgi:hypothetical protein